MGCDTMSNRIFAAVTVAVLVALVGSTLILPVPASAHERRTVAGTYIFVVGWLVEPTFVEEANGVSLVVTNAQTNQPVEGLEKTLKAEVTAGGTSKAFDLAVVFNRDGAYKAEFIPTKTGSYAFRIFGTVGGTQVDERFESGPGRFEDVTSKSEAQFPVKVPSNGELADQLQSRPSAQGGPASVTSAAQATPAPQGASPPATVAGSGGIEDARRAAERADRASSRANTAVMIGIAGLLFGLLGAALGVYGLTAARRTSGSSGATRTGEPV